MSDNGVCRNCEQPLIIIKMAGGYYYVCDNAGKCYLFREAQGCVLNEPKIRGEATSYQLRHDIGILSRKGPGAQRQLAAEWGNRE